MHKATNHSNLVTYDEGLSFIKPHGHLNKWLREVT